MRSGFSDNCFEVLRQEESLLSRFVEVLQNDQEAIAQARAEILEENIRRKEVLLEEMKVLEASKRGLFAEAGLSPGPGGARAEDLVTKLPPGDRARAREAIGRIRALHEALAELNEFTRKIMFHGLALVRSTLAAIHGEPMAVGYAGTGGHRLAASPGRILRTNV